MLSKIKATGLEVFAAENDYKIIPPEKVNNEFLGVLNNTPRKI